MVEQAGPFHSFELCQVLNDLWMSQTDFSKLCVYATTACQNCPLAKLREKGLALKVLSCNI